jgi:putative transposase
MRRMGIEAIYRKRNTSRPHPDHQMYPYLLRHLCIDRPNQVWASDITYIPMARGFVYLVAVIDWYTRKVLAWRLSNTLSTDFCVDAMEDADEIWIAGDLQHRSGLSIHQYQIHRCAQDPWCEDQHGWQRSLA